MDGCLRCHVRHNVAKERIRLESESVASESAASHSARDDADGTMHIPAVFDTEASSRTRAYERDVRRRIASAGGSGDDVST